MPRLASDLLLKLNFRVEIDGEETGHFLKVSGLAAEAAIIEYREGNMGGSAIRLPGLVRSSNVVLKRGLTASPALWNWFKSVSEGELIRRDVAIVHMNARREDVRRWILRDAWPCRYAVSALHARKNRPVLETVELVTGSIELA
jgi:phage tail-like protein